MTCGAMSASDGPSGVRHLARPDLVALSWDKALPQLCPPRQREASPGKSTIGQIAQDIIDSETSCATVLPHATASVFGDAPAWDEFVTVRCVKCDTLLLPVAYAHHLSKHNERALASSQLPNARVVVNKLDSVSRATASQYARQSSGRDDGSESCADEFVRALLSPEHSCTQPGSPPVNALGRLAQGAAKSTANAAADERPSSRAANPDVVVIGTVKAAGGKSVRARKSVVPPAPSKRELEQQRQPQRETAPIAPATPPETSSNAYVVASAGATRLRLKITKASSQTTRSPTPVEPPNVPNEATAQASNLVLEVPRPKASTSAGEETRGSGRRKQRLSVSYESDNDMLTCVSPAGAGATASCSVKPSTSASLDPLSRPYDNTFTALGAKQGDTRERIRTVAAILRQKKASGSTEAEPKAASATPPPVVCTTPSLAARPPNSKLSTSRPVLPALLMPSGTRVAAKQPAPAAPKLQPQQQKPRRLLPVPIKCPTTGAQVTMANGFIRSAAKVMPAACAPRAVVRGEQKPARTVRRKSISPKPAMEAQWTPGSFAWLGGRNGSAPLLLNIYQLRRAGASRARVTSALPSQPVVLAPRKTTSSPAPIVPACTPIVPALDDDSPPVLEAVANFTSDSGSANAHCNLPPLSPVSSPALNECDWKGCDDDTCTPPMGMLGLNVKGLNAQPPIIPLSPVQNSHQDVSIMSISPDDGERSGGDSLSTGGGRALHTARIIPLSPITSGEEDPAGAPTPPMTTHSDMVSNASGLSLQFESGKQQQRQQQPYIEVPRHTQSQQAWCGVQANWYDASSSHGGDRLAQTPTPPMVLMQQHPGAETSGRSVFTLTPVSFAPARTDQHLSSGGKRVPSHHTPPHASAGPARRARVTHRPPPYDSAQSMRQQRHVAAAQHTITTAPLHHGRHVSLNYDQYNTWNKYKAGSNELQRPAGLAPQQAHQYWPQHGIGVQNSGGDAMLSPGAVVGPAVGRNVFVSKMAATQLMQQQHHQAAAAPAAAQSQHALHSGQCSLSPGHAAQMHAAQRNVVYGHGPVGVQQHQRTHADLYGSDMVHGRLVMGATVVRPNVVFATAAGDQQHAPPQHMSMKPHLQS